MLELCIIKSQEDLHLQQPWVEAHLWMSEQQNSPCINIQDGSKETVFQPSIIFC